MPESDLRHSSLRLCIGFLLQDAGETPLPDLIVQDALAGIGHGPPAKLEA